MKLVLKDVNEISRGIWLSNVNARELRELTVASGKKVPETSVISVINLKNPAFDKSNNSIEISISDFSPLAVGMTAEAVLIDQSTHKTGDKAEDAENAPNSLTSFTEACKRENLPGDLIDKMHNLLIHLAKIYIFTLSEGKARKWTTAPNFLAISIQNTKKRFLISVKGNHKNMSYKSIVPKRGMADSYSEFHFSSADQLPEVQHAIERSARIQFGD